MQEVVEERCTPHGLRGKDSTLAIMRHLCAVHGDFHFLITLQNETKFSFLKAKILRFQINARKPTTIPDRWKDVIKPLPRDEKKSGIDLQETRLQRSSFLGSRQALPAAERASTTHSLYQQNQQHLRVSSCGEALLIIPCIASNPRECHRTTGRAGA